MKISLLCTAFLVACAGCGDGGSDSADAAPAFDARPIDRTERAYILSRIVLPTTGEEVDASSFLYPGTDYPVNKMGGLTSVMLDLVQPISVQAQIDLSITDGEVLHGWILDTGPLDEDDPAPTADFVRLEDTDDPIDPSNNLGGTAQLRIAAGEQRVHAITVASMTGGTFEGHGDDETSWGYSLKIHPNEPAPTIYGVHANLRAIDLTDDGFTGASSSATTLEGLYADTYPSIGRLLTYAIEQDVPRATDIRGIFDKDGDGVVTTQELIDNDTMASLSQPDIDLDGDGVNDHISQGVLIEAVRFELVE